MYISAYSSVNFSQSKFIKFKGNSSTQKERPCQLGTCVLNAVDTHSAKKDKLITYSTLLGTGLVTTAGIGCYIYKNASPNYILKKLKSDKFINSFPPNLKLELAKWNKFNKLKAFIMNPEEKYLAGKGANSKVYNLPFLDDYVLKIVKKDSSLDLAKQYIGLFPDHINLGQAVWQSPDNPRVFLLKKIKGEPHSIKNWTTTIYNPITQSSQNVTKQQAEEYYTQISNISKFPQSAFDNLAQQISILDNIKKFDNDYFVGFKIDSINPNNLMVDRKNQTLNLIDYFGKENEHHKNSSMDIVAIISDFTLLPEYMDLLNKTQKNNLINMLKIINKKTNIAANKFGVSTDKNNFRDYIYEVSHYFKPMSAKNLAGDGEYVREYSKCAENLINILEN